MPESACHERRQCSTKPWLLPFRCNTEVHVVAQPLIGVDVPFAQKCTCVLSCLDGDRSNVGEAVPFRTPSLGIDTVVTYTR